MGDLSKEKEVKGEEKREGRGWEGRKQEKMGTGEKGKEEEMEAAEERSEEFSKSLKVCVHVKLLPIRYL